MGGLDLCFGRWDSNSHPIADACPTDLDQALFPGQDYNNARIYDFEDVSKFDMNKLDRKKSSRMGWSDLSICLQGPMVEDLKAHFVQRWNYIYREKYDVTNDARYHPLTLTDTSEGYYKADGKNVVKINENAPPAPSEEESDTLGFGALRHRFRQVHIPGMAQFDGSREVQESSGVSVQLVRSCTKWSNGVATEVS